ncbi:MAG: tyrosine--tRNA ligase, partial [Fibrobacteres bacterium]|nr:tyrosine--tRNA ligase [Fibrobacterota bacterium]
GMIQSKSEGRKLIAQSGLTVNGENVKTHDMPITASLADSKGIIALKKGKKSHYHVKIS